MAIVERYISGSCRVMIDDTYCIRDAGQLEAALAVIADMYGAYLPAESAGNAPS